MAKRYIGSAVTNDSGVATLHYTGRGFGELNIASELRGYTFFRDGGTLYDYNIDKWNYPSSMTVSLGSEYTSVSASSENLTYYELRRSNDGFDFVEDVTVEFDLITVVGNPYIQFSDRTNTLFHYLEGYSNSHVKIINNNGSSSIFVDGVMIGSAKSYSFTKPYIIRFAFGGGQNASIQYKNFCIYKTNTSHQSEGSTHILTDCLFLDKGLSRDHNDFWYVSGATLTRYSEYSELLEEAGSNGSCRFNGTDYSINANGGVCEFDFMQKDGAVTNAVCYVRDNTGYNNSGVSLNIGNFGASLNEWVHVKLTIQDGKVYYTSNKLSETFSKNITTTYSSYKIMFYCGSDVTALRFKNVGVY